MTPEEARRKAQEVIDWNISSGSDGELSALRVAIASALLSAAGGWNADMDAAPRDRPVLLYDARLKRCVVAEWMTAIDDGAQDWVFARQHGLDGIAFVSRDATHWRELPAPPETDG